MKVPWTGSICVASIWDLLASAPSAPACAAFAFVCLRACACDLRKSQKAVRLRGFEEPFRFCYPQVLLPFHSKDPISRHSSSLLARLAIALLLLLY